MCILHGGFKNLRALAGLGNIRQHSNEILGFFHLNFEAANFELFGPIQMGKKTTSNTCGQNIIIFTLWL
jgi:hypothetical protein